MMEPRDTTSADLDRGDEQNPLLAVFSGSGLLVHSLAVEVPGVGSGIAAIATERAAQVTREGWTPDHDDRHDRGELAAAAIAYLIAAVRYPIEVGDRLRLRGLDVWPWEGGFKVRDRRSNLIRAGALIAAELDRLERAEARRQVAETDAAGPPTATTPPTT